MRILEMTTISITAYTFVLPIAEYLRARGHHVTVACWDERREEGKSFVDDIRAKGFDVVIIPMRRSISPLGDIRAIWMLYRHLRTVRYDLLHTQTAKAGFIGRVAARLARVPHVVYTAHAFAFHDYLPWWRTKLYALLERVGSHLCDLIVVDSKAVKDRGLAFGVAPESKIRVVPMGIDADRFSPDVRDRIRESARASLGIRNDESVVGLVARFVPDKGLDTFVSAAAIILKTFPRAVFLMVGDGPLLPAVRAQIASAGLEDSFRLVGMHAYVEPFYAAMDVFMLPTLREGFGVAFSEAMSMGIPVIATRIAPLTEIVIEAETGFFGEPNAPETFAHAACKILGDAGLRRSMATAARTRVLDAFSIDNMVSSHLTLFESMGQ